MSQIRQKGTKMEEWYSPKEKIDGRKQFDQAHKGMLKTMFRGFLVILGIFIIIFYLVVVMNIFGLERREDAIDFSNFPFYEIREIKK